MTRQTSIEAFNAIRDNGLLTELLFFAYEQLYKYGPCTGGELMEAVQRDHPDWSFRSLDNCTKRLSELKLLGVVQELGTRPCATTGHKAIVWDVTDQLPDKEYEKPETLRQKIARLEKRIAELEEENRKLRDELPKQRSLFPGH